MAPVINKKINEFLQKEIVKELLKEIRVISSEKDLDGFFNKFMTPNEKNLIIRRMAAIKLLKQGKRYRKIKELLNISGNTISGAKDILENRGYKRNPNRKIHYSPLARTRKKKYRILRSKYTRPQDL